MRERESNLGLKADMRECNLGLKADMRERVI